MEFVYRGLDIPFESAKESFALLAYNREQQMRFYSVLSIVSAIISTGNKIVIALSGQPGEDKAGKTVGEAMDALRELLLPGDSFAEERKMDRVMRILEKEVNKGPIRIRPQATGKKRKRGLAKKRQE